VAGELGWFPEYRLVDAGAPDSGATVSWVSGNATADVGNTFFLSAREGEQTRPTALRFFAMAAGCVCVLDGSAVPPLCGALQLNFQESNIAAGQARVAVRYDSSPACALRFDESLVSSENEGTVWVFAQPNCAASSGTPDFLRLASTDFVAAQTMAIGSVVVPENLLLVLRDLGASRQVLELYPGTYDGVVLRSLNPLWPTGVVNFSAYCRTLSARAVYKARVCSGFAGSESRVWLPDCEACSLFMDDVCRGGILANASVCGCYQDQAALAAAGFGAIAPDMVNLPQCWGEVCSRGSAYRKPAWRSKCGNICQQTIALNGDAIYYSGKQSIVCNGDVFNLPTPAGTPPAPAVVHSPTPWIAGTVVAGVVAAVFLVLFALVLAKRLPRKTR
jgi:hypothetical protein